MTFLGRTCENRCNDDYDETECQCNSQCIAVGNCCPDYNWKCVDRKYDECHNILNYHNLLTCWSHSVFCRSIISNLWKERKLNSGGQEFHECKQNEQSRLASTHWI